ncbi:DNA polymerase I [Candidatus Uhrbacteria bacterium]|nr:DNA polymerase I [Candidatus Uhrbacteria bacterium]
MALQSKKLLLIDANALLHRAWHALPPLTTKQGEVVNAMYGFLLMLFKVIPQVHPDSIIAAFDRKGPTFRHKIFEQYKAQRVKQADELYEQFPKLKEILTALGICVLEHEGYEADDIIGTIATTESTRETPTHVIILTGDMDTMQLVNHSVNVLCFKKGVSETTLYDINGVTARYGLAPEQLIDYKALRGDPSDNIPGVKGIGEKTATELLQRYESIEGILKELSKPSSTISPAVAAKLQSPDTDLELNRTLVRIDRNVAIDYSLEQCQWGAMDRPRVMELFQRYEFESLVKKIPGAQEQAPTPANPKKSVTEVTPSDKQSWVKISSADESTAFLNTVVGHGSCVISFVNNTAGFVMTAQSRHAYYPEFIQGDAAILKTLLTLNGAIQWIGHDLKQEFKKLMDWGLPDMRAGMDTMIASYLLSPGSRAHSLSNLVFSELKKEIPGVTSTQQQLLQKPTDDIAETVGRNIAIAELSRLLDVKIREDKLTTVFETIELPLIPVLARMERAGIAVDPEELTKLKTKLTRTIKTLETEITNFAGEPFNINSTQQLRHILFERLQLPTKGISKTKTGLSTAAEELEKLQDAHPIIPKLGEYRELTKLLNTYVEALPHLIHPKTGRIYTTFNQTVAATGRLSSSDPNLQNIPIRTELGNEVRNAFVCGRGLRLLSLDYNQIELRVVASLSKDEKMIASFNSGEDIHARTAAEVFGVPIQEVSTEMRRTAKTVNFGVLYGLGSTGLAQTTGMTRAQAKDFIDRYFTVYAAVHAFMEGSKQFAREHGYVQTLFGRKRHLPDIHSGMAQVRAQAERVAANMPIQGTAADIMKLAMIAIDKQLTNWSPTARMLLQVHDELVFEVAADEVDTVAKKAAHTMESVMTLNVPIVAHAKVGARWGSMTPLQVA